MIKMNYETQEERDNIIQSKTGEGLYLIEDAILDEEKYLIFDNKPLDIQEPEPTTEEILLAALIEIQNLKNKVAELEGK